MSASADFGASIRRLTIEDTPLESPSVGAPHPVSERVVAQSRPAEDEEHGREDSASLGGSTQQDRGDERGEHLRCVSMSLSRFLICEAAYHLVSGKDDGGKTTVGLGDWLVQNTPETDVGTVTKERAAALAEDETVSDEEPLERDDGERDNRQEEEGQCVFTARETGVEVTQTGQL